MSSKKTFVVRYRRLDWVYIIANLLLFVTLLFMINKVLLEPNIFAILWLTVISMLAGSLITFAVLVHYLDNINVFYKDSEFEVTQV